MGSPPLRKVLVGCLLGAGLLAASCSSAEDPGYLSPGDDIRVEEGRIFWLDDDTLVFPARRTGGSSAYDMYVWTPGSSDPQVYRQPEWVDQDRIYSTYFCASNDEVIFSGGPLHLTDTPGLFEYAGIAGRPGEQAPRTIRSFRPLTAAPGVQEEPRGLTPYNGVWTPYGRQSGVRCEEPSDPDMVGKWWAYTYPDTPYVVFDQARDSSYTNARLQGAGIDLPLAVQDGFTAPSCVHATPWNGRVWAWSCRAGPPDDPAATGAFTYAAWDIDPRTGDVVRTDIPLTPTTRNLFAIPTKAGLFVASDIPPKVGESGLFKLVNGREQLRLKGRFGAAYVSPDGCRIALAKYPSSNGFVPTLVVVNVCQET